MPCGEIPLVGQKSTMPNLDLKLGWVFWAPLIAIAVWKFIPTGLRLIHMEGSALSVSHAFDRWTKYLNFK